MEDRIFIDTAKNFENGVKEIEKLKISINKFKDVAENFSLHIGSLHEQIKTDDMVDMANVTIKMLQNLQKECSKIVEQFNNSLKEITEDRLSEITTLTNSIKEFKSITQDFNQKINTASNNLEAKDMSQSAKKTIEMLKEIQQEYMSVRTEYEKLINLQLYKENIAQEVKETTSLISELKNHITINSEETKNEFSELSNKYKECKLLNEKSMKELKENNRIELLEIKDEVKSKYSELKSKYEIIEQGINLIMIGMKEQNKLYRESLKTEISNTINDMFSNVNIENISKKKYNKNTGYNERSLDEYELAKIHYERYINNEDLKEAFEMYEKAASKGNNDAIYKLGEMHYNGEWVLKDTEEAINLFEKSANQGHKRSRVKLIEIYEELSNIGYIDAEYKLGEIYYKGEWIQKNVDKAITLYERAANKGDKNSRKKAIKIYMDQANKNCMQSKCKLGEIYYKGEWIEKDVDESIKWYHKAVNQGSSAAKNKLGEIYYNIGEKYINLDGGEKEAIKWFEKSSQQEYADAQYKLGEMYRKGIYVKKDNEKAMEWYKKAANQGHLKALTESFKLSISDTVINSSRFKR